MVEGTFELVSSVTLFMSEQQQIAWCGIDDRSNCQQFDLSLTVSVGTGLPTETIL